jgi:hypothetical protein
LIGISLVFVIAAWLCALQIWNITTLTRSLSTARGWIRLIAGCAVAFAALAMLYFSLPAWAEDAFSVFSIATFLTALAVEFIVGEDIRALYARRN